MDKEKPSFMASVAERYVKARKSVYFNSADAASRYLKTGAHAQEHMGILDLVRFGRASTVKMCHQMKIVSYGEKNRSRHPIIYLHGGAYVKDVHFQHLNFCRSLSRKADACVVLPLYPLAPEHTCPETYSLLTELYKDILRDNPGQISIMGDSAGGGLTLGFTGHLKKIGLPLPQRLVVFSPWVDVSMTLNDHEPFEDKDTMLCTQGLIPLGEAWAGDLDTKDPLVSPSFGNCDGFPDTLIFTGTHEILYPDICDYYKKMNGCGVNVRLVTGEGMPHVYPLYPIPEAREAMSVLLSFLESDNTKSCHT